MISLLIAIIPLNGFETEFPAQTKSNSHVFSRDFRDFGTEDYRVVVAETFRDESSRKILAQAGVSCRFTLVIGDLLADGSATVTSGLNFPPPMLANLSVFDRKRMGTDPAVKSFKDVELGELNSRLNYSMVIDSFFGNERSEHTFARSGFIEWKRPRPGRDYVLHNFGVVYTHIPLIRTFNSLEFVLTSAIYGMFNYDFFPVTKLLYPAPNIPGAVAAFNRPSTLVVGRPQHVNSTFTEGNSKGTQFTAWRMAGKRELLRIEKGVSHIHQRLSFTKTSGVAGSARATDSKPLILEWSIEIEKSGRVKKSNFSISNIETKMAQVLADIKITSVLY